MLKNLNKQEKKIFIEYALKSTSIQAIAEMIGTTRYKMAQIIKKIQNKILSDMMEI